MAFTAHMGVDHLPHAGLWGERDCMLLSEQPRWRAKGLNRGPASARRRLAAALAAGGLALLACGPAAGLLGGGTPTRLPASAATGVATAAATPTSALATATSATAVASGIQFVPGSSRKVCQLAGETDKQLNAPTVNQTETKWGLSGTDLGYAVEHDGKLFFLFGDSSATRDFNGQPNGPNSPARSRDDNDAIAFTTDASIATLAGCPRLTFIHGANGAYQSPVVLNAQGQPAITLRNDEIPTAGLSDGGHLYVFFATDNPVYLTGTPSPGNLGRPTRSVVGVSDDDGNTFHYAYDFSKGPRAKFITVAAAQGNDGYVYVWGTPDGALYRRAPPYLARTVVGSLGRPDGWTYWQGLTASGAPVFLPGESNASPLFHDSRPNAAGQPQVADCMGELGAAWNPFVKRWLLLYNCDNDSPGHPRGIYLRAAGQPWGPWSAPQTIFNPERDNGLCQFIHRAVTAAQPQCDNLAAPARLAEPGGVYGPFFLSRYTSGDAAQGTSTFYYTMSTWIPYTQVIMQTTIQRAP
jgi:hypothetical protein